jgi:hypothetical protein
MTTTELTTWLTTNYPRGEGINRLAFVADVDATLAALGAEPISLSQLNNWLSRTPPETLAGRAFDQFLALVLERRDNPERAAAIYTINFAVSAQENEVLLKTAKRAKATPQAFLELCTRIGFEDQTGLDKG